MGWLQCLHRRPAATSRGAGEVSTDYERLCERLDKQDRMHRDLEEPITIHAEAASAIRELVKERERAATDIKGLEEMVCWFADRVEKSRFGGPILTNIIPKERWCNGWDNIFPGHLVWVLEEAMKRKDASPASPDMPDTP